MSTVTLEERSLFEWNNSKMKRENIGKILVVTVEVGWESQVREVQLSIFYVQYSKLDTIDTIGYYCVPPVVPEYCW